MPATEDVEITELEEFEPDRVDGVKSAANGFPILMIKSADADTPKPRVGETMTEFKARVATEKSVAAAQAEGPIAGKTPTPHAGSDGAAPSGAAGSNEGSDCSTCGGDGEVDGAPCPDCDGAKFSEADVKDADHGAAQDGDKREAIDKAQKPGCGCCDDCDSDCDGDCCDDCSMGEDAEKSACCDEEDCEVCKEILAKKKLSYGERKRLPKGSFVFPKERRYPIHDECLAGDTLVKLLDGRLVPIAELVDQEPWIYAYDLDRRSIVPAQATNIRLTRTNAFILNVTLDNGAIVRCTGNHPFLLRDGTYRLAEELVPGDSLMPLYSKVTEQFGQKAYEQIRQPFYGFWDWTHRMVCREMLGRPIAEDCVVHHVDNDARNNHPDNLQEIGRDEHCSLEAGIAGTDRSRDDANARLAEGSRQRWATPGAREKQAEVMRRENERRRASGEMIEISGKISHAKFEYWRQRRIALPVVEMYEKYEAGATLNGLAREYGASARTVKSRFEEAGLTLRHNRVTEPNNHKVVSITAGGMADVYDLEVPETSNFALAAGIFVHNSHARNALARVSQFGTPEEKAKVRAAVHRKYPNIDQASAAKSESEPVVKDGIVSGPNPFLATADDGDDKSDDGSADAPGSSAWEAVDAATAEEAAVALMSAAEKIREFASREAQEVAAGEGNDVFDTFAAEQALSATMSAVGVMAQMAFHEGLAAAKSEGSDVEKAGRRLSSKTVGALTALRDHVNNLLGDDDPAHPRTDEAVEDAAKSILDKEIETLTLDELMKALDERDEARRVAEEAAKAEAEEAAKGKSETEQVASVASAKRENKRKRNKASEQKKYDALEDEAAQGDGASASGTRDAEGGAKSVAEDGAEVETTDEVAEPAEKAELTEEEIEANEAAKQAKQALKAAKKAKKAAAENAALKKALEESRAEAEKAVETLKQQLEETTNRLETVEKMAAPSTVVRTRPADAMQKASERDALDVEINRLEQLVKSTQDRDIREGSRARMVELRQQRDAL